MSVVWSSFTSPAADATRGAAPPATSSSTPQLVACRTGAASADRSVTAPMMPPADIGAPPVDQEPHGERRGVPASPRGREQRRWGGVVEMKTVGIVLGGQPKLLDRPYRRAARGAENLPGRRKSSRLPLRRVFRPGQLPAILRLTTLRQRRTGVACRTRRDQTGRRNGHRNGGHQGLRRRAHAERPEQAGKSGTCRPATRPPVAAPSAARRPQRPAQAARIARRIEASRNRKKKEEAY